MKHYGFTINRLTLTGPSVKDAELLFHRGLNVITGPSDTGKTFAFECINFMLGAKKLPKIIPEAEGYDSVCLDIYDPSTDSNMSLTRSLKGGSFILNSSGEEINLKGRHSASNENSVSNFFLKLSNIQDKKIRTNNRGVTKSFSFRHMAHLSVISEENIIKNISPVLSGQNSLGTEEKSAYKLLLSGLDDSTIIEIPDPKEIKKNFEAKEELLKELITENKLIIEKLQVKATYSVLIEELNKIESSIDECLISLNELEEQTSLLEEIKRDKWDKLKKVESRLDVIAELQARFSLLNDQYHSDMSRLQAIAESGIRLDEINLEHCPVCGALADYHDWEYQECHIDPVDVAKSCTSEISKIKGFISDLKLTQNDLLNKSAEISILRIQYQNELEVANLNLKNHLDSKINNIISHINEQQEEKEKILKAIYLYEQLNELEGLIAELKERKNIEQNRKPTFVDPDVSYFEKFSKIVEKTLEAWKFPDLERVTFDEKSYDLIISGRNRSSHGKGVRAITHAAFTISLLRYCIDNELPHSKNVVIDSPLVVYKQPDVGEEIFSRDVKSAFYYDLSQSYKDCQVIIIENDAPPEDLETSGSVNIIRFTGTDDGRWGFIPIKNS